MNRLLILLLSLALLVSCKAKQVVMNTDTSTDSVRVEVREVKTIEYLKDTLYLEVPVEIKEQVKQDSSFLETSFASSEAKILASGLLFHNLENKAQKLPEIVEVPIEVIRVDSVYIQGSNTEVIKEIPVRMPMRWWEMTFFYIGMVSVVIFACWLAFKVFRL